MRILSLAITFPVLFCAGSLWRIGPSFFVLNTGEYSRQHRNNNVEMADAALPPKVEVAALPSQQHDRIIRSGSKRPFVHIVSSRFMQHQPSLLHLGKARLSLLKAFCLPTLVHQTSTNFLWIIRTDPALDLELLDELMTLLLPYPHFFLIRTNENDDGVTNLKAIISNTTFVVTGDVTLLEEAAAALEKKSTPIRIETRLDADDGLRIDYLEHIQNVTMKRKIKNSRFVYYCIDGHLEWHSSALAAAGAGQLLATRKTICVTPGLTIATMPTSVKSSAKLPRVPHHKLAATVPPCTKKKDTNGACLMRLVKFAGPAAIRARTPTSAGMADIVEQQQKSANDDDPTDETWEHIYKTFGISVDQVKESQTILATEMAAIAKDNLAGQCTKGHSCKSTSKKKLLQIIRDRASNSSITDFPP